MITVCPAKIGKINYNIHRVSKQIENSKTDEALRKQMQEFLPVSVFFYYLTVYLSQYLLT